MVCIYCGAKTRITNSRPQKRLLQTWRRHTCTRCHAVFTTHEQADLSGSLRVRFPDGSLKPYERMILLLSIYEALGHRSDALEAAKALEATITARLLKMALGAKLTRLDIVVAAHDSLRHFDHAGAVSYHAHHH